MVLEVVEVILEVLEGCVGSEHCSEHCLFQTSVPNICLRAPLKVFMKSLYGLQKLPPRGGRGKPLPTFGELLKTL